MVSRASSLNSAETRDPGEATLVPVVPPTRKVLSLAAPIGLGMLLWSVVCLEPLQLELAAPSARPPVVLLHLQPIAVLLLGLAVRSSVFTMVAFPSAIAASFFVLDPLDLLPLSTMRGALTVAGALVAFVAGTALLGPRRIPTHTIRGTKLVAGVDPQSRLRVRHWWVWAALLLGLWVVPLWPLYEPGANEALTRAYGAGRKDAIALIHTAHVFIATLATYIFIVLPAINASVERYSLRRRLARYRSVDARRLAVRRLLLYVLAGVVFVFLLILLRAR